MNMTPAHTILLVDDNPANLSVLVGCLADQDYRVLTAESGERALEIIARVRPDIVLMDVIMPGMGGLEACRCIREDEAHGDIPVIFLSALDEAQDKVKGLQSGAVDYISKPLHQEEVLMRVNTHLTISRLQKELKQKVEDLDQSIRQRDALIEDLNAYAHTVAHDLKNPVGLICGMAETINLMYPNVDGEVLKRRLDMINSASWKLRAIIDDLLFFAGVAKESVQRRDIAMRPVVDQALERLDNLVSGREVGVSIAEDLPAASGHEQWVEEVWYNYISNAIKYGGTPCQIRIGGRRESSYVVYWVCDNGEGINAEDLSQLFSPGRPNEAQHDSHGIGLSIVKRIVQKLDGEVWAESVLGEGSVFYFSLHSSLV